MTIEETMWFSANKLSNLTLPLPFVMMAEVNGIKTTIEEIIIYVRGEWVSCVNIKS